MTDALDICLAGHLIGAIRPDGSIAWDPDWSSIAPLNSPVLSHSIPFGASAVDVAPFFGGLLPEGLGLERLAREARVASNDLFGLLSEVGADVGGAVTVGEPHPPLDPIVIKEGEYDRILSTAAGYIRGSAVGGGGSAATGVQPKLALTWDPSAEQWMIGRGSTPSTHLLKPVPNEYAARVRSEAYLNAIARTLELSTHDARVEPAGERVVLVVERYDRIREDSGIRRIHQEDAAQALGLPWGGNDKYESVNARASLKRVAGLLPQPAFSSGVERNRLLALTVLNIVAGNTDAHAKNFSFLLPSPEEAFDRSTGATHLADAYDVVPQALFEVDSSPLAMKIAGRSEAGAVTASDLVSEAVSWGMPEADATSGVTDTLTKLLAALATEHAQVPRSVPLFLEEQASNLLRGDRAWTRSIPPAIAITDSA